MSAQESILEHHAPVGSTGSLVLHRGYENDTYTLTPSTSDTLPLIRELIMYPDQGARVTAESYFLEYAQATGGARKLRRIMAKHKVLPTYT
jgi:hypothetical protein